jgi:hypothetical protein
MFDPDPISLVDLFGPQFEPFVTDHSVVKDKSLDAVASKYRSLLPYAIIMEKPKDLACSEITVNAIQTNIALAQRVLSIVFSQITPDFDFLDCPSPADLFALVHQPPVLFSPLFPSALKMRCMRYMSPSSNQAAAHGQQFYAYFEEDPSFISSFGYWTFPGFYAYFQTESTCSAASSLLCSFLDCCSVSTLELSAPLLSSFFLCSFKFLASLWHRFHFETGYESMRDENAFLIKLVRIISDLSLLFDDPHRRVLLKVRDIDPHFAVSFLKAKFLHTCFLWYFGQGRYCLSRIETDLARQTLTNPNESHDDGLLASFFVMPPSPLALPRMPKPVYNFSGVVDRFDSIPFVTTPRALSILPHVIRPENAQARHSTEKFREDILLQGNYRRVVFPFFPPANRPSDPLKSLPHEESKLLRRQGGTLEKFGMINEIARNEANLNLMSGFLEWIDVGRQHEYYGESIKSVYDVLLFAYSDLILDLPGRTLASDEILPAITIEVHKIADNELKFPSLVSVLDRFRMLLNDRLSGILEGFRITEMEQREISKSLLVYRKGEKGAAVQKRLERSARELKGVLRPDFQISEGIEFFNPLQIEKNGDGVHR